MEVAEHCKSQFNLCRIIYDKIVEPEIRLIESRRQHLNFRVLSQPSSVKENRLGRLDRLGVYFEASSYVGEIFEAINSRLLLSNSIDRMRVHRGTVDVLARSKRLMHLSQGSFCKENYSRGLRRIHRIDGELGLTFLSSLGEAIGQVDTFSEHEAGTWRLVTGQTEAFSQNGSERCRSTA